jgi:hypothetical protein
VRGRVVLDVGGLIVCPYSPVPAPPGVVKGVKATLAPSDAVTVPRIEEKVPVVSTDSAATTDPTAGAVVVPCATQHDPEGSPVALHGVR